jgi:spermidine synthase
VRESFDYTRRFILHDMLHAIIFVTGGAILALELLASRILTPYFGVSLYIWSGILSITLVSLAAGYWQGGRLAAGTKKHAPSPDRLATLYARMPAIAAIAIVAACLIYPFLFHRLAHLDLVFGAFVACIVLLFVPLYVTSAMNPLLVAILLRQSEARGELADAGAGRVFFISTIGSVAGVIVTAFGLIQFLSNFAATLVVAAILAALPLALLFASSVRFAQRRQLTIVSGVALAAALALLAGGNAYTALMWPANYGGAPWHIDAVYRSSFGTVKVLKSGPRDGEPFTRMYFHDGLVQNIVGATNRSMSMYTYALEALSFSYRPDMRKVLVLGIGAGMVPMRLAGRGIDVTAVDIDPASLRAATEIFELDARKVHVRQADARTYLRSCENGYDVVIIDLFHGDGVPDYLVTREFFRDLKRCAGPKGIAVFNTFADLDHPRSYAHFLTTLKSELPFITLYRPNYGLARHINSFIVASGGPLPEPSGDDLRHVPLRHEIIISAMLRDPIALDQQLLANGRVITDADNPATNDFAESQMINRRYAIEALPAAFFVN